MGSGYVCVDGTLIDTDMETNLKEIQRYVDYLKDRIVILAEQNQELKDENYKDKELNNLSIALISANHHALFMLSDIELDRLNAFKQRHRKCGKTDSTWDYKFYHTELGTAVEVVCPGCKRSLDITDYSRW